MDFLNKNKMQDAIKVDPNQSIEAPSLTQDSQQGSPLQGNQLIHTVVELTELPKEWVGEEVYKLISQSGHGSENLTLEQLRSVMLEYLEEVQLAMEKDFAESNLSHLNDELHDPSPESAELKDSATPAQLIRRTHA